MEDGWGLASFGGEVLEAVKPCARCVVITVDQGTGQRRRDADPLSALVKHHPGPTGHPIFGQNLTPRSSGIIRVGDVVQVPQ